MADVMSEVGRVRVIIQDADGKVVLDDTIAAQKILLGGIKQLTTFERPIVAEAGQTVTITHLKDSPEENHEQAL